MSTLTFAAIVAVAVIVAFNAGMLFHAFLHASGCDEAYEQGRQAERAEQRKRIRQGLERLMQDLRREEAA